MLDAWVNWIALLRLIRPRRSIWNSEKNYPNVYFSRRLYGIESNWNLLTLTNGKQTHIIKFDFACMRRIVIRLSIEFQMNHCSAVVRVINADRTEIIADSPVYWIRWVFAVSFVFFFHCYSVLTNWLFAEVVHVHHFCWSCSSTRQRIGIAVMTLFNMSNMNMFYIADQSSRNLWLHLQVKGNKITKNFLGWSNLNKSKEQ